MGVPALIGGLFGAWVVMGLLTRVLHAAIWSRLEMSPSRSAIWVAVSTPLVFSVVYAVMPLYFRDIPTEEVLSRLIYGLFMYSVGAGIWLAKNLKRIKRAHNPRTEASAPIPSNRGRRLRFWIVPIVAGIVLIVAALWGRCVQDSRDILRETQVRQEGEAREEKRRAQEERDLEKLVAVFGSERVVKRFKRQWRAVRSDAKFQEKMSKYVATRLSEPASGGMFGEGDQFLQEANIGAELSRRGVARLSAHDLGAQIALKLKMADASPATCAALWSGTLKPAELGAALDGLQDPELDEWIRLGYESQRLELYATTPPDPLTEEQFTGVLRKAFNTLPLAEQDRFRRVMEQGDSAPPEAACWGFKLIFSDWEGLAASEQHTLHRAFAAGESLGLL